ncbi:MAG: hypothetical protein ACU85V_13165 [Gammaproteobacteria bacterium]
MPVPPHHSRPSHVAVTALASLECLAALWGLRATWRHRAAYELYGQWLLEMGVFLLLLVVGVGLLRRRRWAARLSSALLYLAFLVLLAALMYGFGQWHGEWWYWLLLPALPAVGALIYALRQVGGRRTGGVL